MSSKPDASSKIIENERSYQIENANVCYEAVQFSYFDEEKMSGWLENGSGVVKVSYYGKE